MYAKAAQYNENDDTWVKPRVRPQGILKQRSEKLGCRSDEGCCQVLSGMRERDR
jgi:hypothetical protein